MPLTPFYPGEVIHCYLSSVASSSGGIVDPTPLLFTYFPPTTEAPTVATTSGSVITTGISGTYYASITPTTAQVGTWHYRWSATGNYPLSQWGAFRVIEPPRST